MQQVYISRYCKINNHSDTIMSSHGLKNIIKISGGDCHKYLNKEVFSEIFGSIPEEVKRLTKEPHLLLKAKALSTKFIKLFSMFAEVYELMSHSNFIDDDSLVLIDKRVTQFMTYIREKFPDESITLKLHLLEDHLVESLTKYRFGCGLFGEQGVESVHHKINQICGRYKQMPDPVARLKTTIEEHHMHTLPQIRQNVPEPRKKE